MLKTISNVILNDATNEMELETVQPAARPIPRSRLHLNRIFKAEEFLALEQDWKDLFIESGFDHQVFQSFAWLYHWHSVFIEGASQADGPRLALVTGRINGKLAMVWPLVERRSAGVRTIEWMGAPVSQYGDVILAPHREQGSWFDAGLAYIKSELKPDAIILNSVRADSQFARLCQKSNVICLNTEQAPYLDLSRFQTFADFRADYSTRTRKTRSRKRRRFMEKPKAKAEIVNEGARASEIARDTLDIKRQWLEGRNVVSRAFSNSKFDAFMERVVSTKDRSVNVLVSAFSFDGHLVSGEIGFCNKDTYFSHVAAYDLNHARLSAGVLQFEDTIEYCFNNDIHKIDLLAPSDPYKLEWATGTVRVDDWAIPLSAKGYIAIALKSGWSRKWMVKCAHVLPKSLRKILAGFVAKTL